MAAAGSEAARRGGGGWIGGERRGRRPKCEDGEVAADDGLRASKFIIYETT
eukprot:SAG31_NODE_258_length_18937_cov_61.688555_28_plen_51_part_00